MRSSHLTLLLFLIWLLPAAALADGSPVRVQITGVEGRLLDNVRVFLGILHPQAEGKLSDYQVHRLYAHAPAEIRAALEPFGYYSPRIDSKLEQKKGKWLALFHIDPGSATRLTAVDIRAEGEGRDNPAVRAALAKIGLAKGQVLNHVLYDQAKQALIGAAYDAGYLDARYTHHELRVEPERQAAQIHLVLDTGERYFFGPVTIDQDILAPDFVHRFVDFEPGDPFSTEKLLGLQLALRDSEYFSSVEMHADKSQAVDHRVPVQVGTEPTKPQKYLFSIGYGTDTGPRVGFGVLFRRINRHGHQFRINAQISEVKSNIRSQYKIPVGNVATDFVDFTADVEQNDVADINSRQYAIGTSYNNGWLGGRRRLYLTLQRESYSFGNGPSRQTDLFFPGIRYSRKIADNLLFTRKGYSFNVDAHGASEQVLSDTSFVRTEVSLRTVYPLGARGRLLLHAEYGAVKVTDFDALPPSQRFFAGGARSVRGYAYKELGPHNADGDTIGGRYLAVGSVEADYLVYGNFGVAAFFDAGNAANNPLPDPKRGVGVGLRYRTPVGMIRLDVAHPLDDPDRNWRIHVSIGPDL